MNSSTAKWLLALLLSLAAWPACAEDTVVLIVSADSKVENLDSLQVRKLFLGMTVDTRDGERLRPLLNESDARLRDVFLQNIVSMTDMTYDRRILRLALQGGRSLPTVFNDKAALISAVATDPTAVSFAWAKDVQRDKRIRILRVLWHD